LKANAFFSFLFLLLVQGPLYAQQRDSSAFAPSPGDSLPAVITVRFSPDSLDAPVDYGAVDSIVLDNAGKKVYLYGQAFVKYRDIDLTADYIVFDWAENLVYAEGAPDSTGALAGFPEFTQGEQELKAKRMRYNFKTGKGIVYDVTTQQDDIVLHGSRTKFVTLETQDTAAKQILYSEDALITTCTADHPHFGILSTKQKVIPNKLVIIGPSQLKIMDIPTPIWLPFGFFPISKKASTGLLFPRDYEYSDQWGFGLRDIGWFFPLGETINLSLRTDVYLRGTWGVNATSDYRKRYKYSGSLRLGFDSRKTEDLKTSSFFRTNAMSINWSHRQETGAHPSARFGGSINIQTNNYQNRVFNDAANVLNAQLSSNMSFDKSWPGKPYNFSASFNHTQNRLTRSVNVNFPDLRFLTQSLYPFKRKERVGEEKWYETIVLRYTGEARNRFLASDTTLFSRQTLQDAQFGARHDMNASTSFKLLKYFNLNPNVSYRETWQWRSVEKDFDPTPVVRTDTVYNSDRTLFQLRNDTLSFGRQTIDTLSGFKAFREFSASLSLNTRIFGTLNFGKGFLRSVRHEIRPSVSMVFSPNYLSPSLGYFREVQRDLRFDDQLDQYSIFEGGIFGVPPSIGEQMAISYSLNNIFQAKVQGKQDTVARRIKLIDNLILSGNYNLAADSLKFSPVIMTTTTRLFKGVTTVGFFAQFDPYLKDNTGRRINVSALQARGQLLRFENASLRFVSDLTVGKLRAIFQGQTEEVVEDVRNRNTQSNNTGQDDFLSLFENFSISHNIDFTWQADASGKTSLRIGNNSIYCRGNLQMTKNWSVVVGNFGYDFSNRGLSYPSFGFARDLHCWTMDLSWQPQRGTYSFNIRVKPGTLDFIKIPYQRNNVDRGAVF
jgi:hypothetical protein